MKEFVTLKPKAYTYTTQHDDVYHSTLKGVPKHIRDILTLDMYKDCLYNNTQTRGDLFNLIFYNGDMSLTKNSKIILSSYEDKRFYINNLKSYGNGHYKCKTHHIGGEDNRPNDGTEERRSHLLKEQSSGRNYRSIFEKRKNKMKKKKMIFKEEKQTFYNFDFHLQLISIFYICFLFFLQDPEVTHNCLVRVG